MLRVSEYINDMDLCMAAADLVISRAGAITLSEIEVQGKAAVLIPSPYVAENHQYHNAMTLENRGAAMVIEEKDLTGELLSEKVGQLLQNPQKLTEMGAAARSGAYADANERIYNALMKLIKR
jgi:UDP-N-acetylglucosamine--N-acetylmuramyl-(pentapeptide) pyrophosphoryl-undecaprenol N-acetylglucosamine transferase